MCLSFFFYWHFLLQSRFKLFDLVLLMQRIWKHVPRWLSIVSYLMLSIVLLYMGGYAAIYRVSDANSLQTRAQKLLQDTGYRLHFNGEIQRHLFPRPTIILNQVRLDNAAGQADMQVQEMRIGIAWQSLWDTPAIEKLVLEQAQGRLYRLPSGEWNVARLTRGAHGEQLPQFQRIQVNNSRLDVKYDAHSMRLENVQLLVFPESNAHRYVLRGESHIADWEQLNLNATGQALVRDGSLHLPDLTLKFNGSEQGYQFTGNLKSAIQWGNTQWVARQTKWTVNSERYQSNISSTIERVEHNEATQQTLLRTVSLLLTAKMGDYSHNATLEMAQSQFDAKRVHSDEVEMKLTSRSLTTAPVILTFNSALDWSLDSGWSLPKFKLLTLQELPNASRFNSEWEGSLHAESWEQWRMDAQGLFDRQPSNVVLQRDDQGLAGSLNLAKLKITPYLRDVALNQLLTYPTWLGQLPPLNLQLQLDQLELPNVNIDNIRSTVSGDGKRLLFKPLTADLYNGQSAGSLQIDNATPLRYRVQQHLQGVEIKPLLQDLFGSERISGQGNADFDLTSHGSNYRDWLANLSGTLTLDVKDGEWVGIDFERLAQTINQTARTNNAPIVPTPFSRFQLSTRIDKGISRHRTQVSLLRPVAYLQGDGEFDLPNQTLREDILISGEGTRAPLPLRISGNPTQPEISINYQKMTAGLTTPEEKQQAVSSALKQQWQWLLRPSGASAASNPSE